MKLSLFHWKFGIFIAISVLLYSCAEKGSTGVSMSTEEKTQDSLLQVLFSPATSAELTSIRESWQNDNLGVDQFRVIFTDTLLQDSTDTLLAHIVVYGSDGFEQYGAVLVPSHSTEALPVLYYSHGGDAGTSLDGEVALLLSMAPDLWKNFMVLVPSFRSEPLIWADSSWISEGEPSPWDRDVLDFLRLFSAADSLQIHPVNRENQSALGFSRGAGVALLASLRDTRITRIADYFGPTDFLSPFVRTVVDSIFAENPPELPGLDAITEQVIVPWQNGILSTDSVRKALIQRSPAQFAQDLPTLYIHHGTADTVVPIAQSDTLYSRLKQGSYYQQYTGVGHNPFGMLLTLGKTIQFLRTGSPETELAFLD